MRNLSIGCILLLLVSAGLYGQTSELGGRVTDPTGNVVPAAEITLTRQGTQTVQERATNGSDIAALMLLRGILVMV